MNILYGVQATGNGHISRSREVLRALKQAGHTVHVVFSGRDPEELWDIEMFKPFTAFKGLTFAYRRGKIKYLQTLKVLSPLQFFRDINSFDAGGYDLAIVDFEPVTARIVRRCKLTSIGIGHQYAFQYPVPLAKWDPVSLAVLNYFAPVDHSLGLHWHHFGHPVLPPIIPNMPMERCENNPKKILVYLPFEERRDVIRLLKPLQDFGFYYYTGIDEAYEEGPIQLNPFSRDGFLSDLLTCGGVICNAGFELASEALHLGKKLLVRPLAGQLEQTSNALALKRLGLADVMKTLDRSVVETWLAKPQQASLNYPDVAAAIADWIGTGRWHDTGELVERVWSGVNMSAMNEP